MSAEQPWTIKRLLQWTTDFLRRKGSESARLEAEVLLAHALGCERIELYTQALEEASESVRKTFRELVQKRVEGCPVAYLVGIKEFFSLEFEVSPAVLIPRPETEHLVMECLQIARAIPEPLILDVGTGSGCLAVTLARQHPGADLTAIDLSPEALAIAGRNADRHEVVDRLRFLEGDLFGPLAPGEQFDIIVSNPPYVPRDEIPTLATDVRDHEPHLALDGGPDGLEVFRRLIHEAPAYLRERGHLFVEMGRPEQEASVRQLFQEIEGYTLSPTIPDSAGRPRVLHAQWKASQE